MTFLRVDSRLRVLTFTTTLGILALSVLALAQQAAPPGPPRLPQELLDRDAQTAELAAEAARRGPVTPIPLMNGSRIVGVVYDQYLTGVVIGRAQIAAGQAPDAKAIAAHPSWQARGTVIVAYPLDCDGKPNQPLAIRWTSQIQAPVQPEPIAGPMPASSAQSLLPGVAIPEGSLVVNLRNVFMILSAAVDVDYAGPVCRGAARTASLPVRQSPNALGLARAGGIPMKLPAELASLSPSTVRVQVTLDPTGRVRFPVQVQGPPELLPLALAYLTPQTFPPATTNGVPMPFNAMPAFVFTATGEPAPPAPFTPAPPRPGTQTFTTSSTIAVPAARPVATSSTPVPPAPPGQTDALLARVAIEVAAKSDPVPVPLDAAGGAARGALFDRFLIAALKARAAFKAGSPMDPAAASADLLREDLVAVAYPLACDGRIIAPQKIEMNAGGVRAGPVSPRGSLLADQALRDRLPGAVLPNGAVGQPFLNVALSQGLEVRVTYATPPCGGTDSSLSFSIQWVLAQSQPSRLTTAKLPSTSSLPSPTPVRLRGIVDLDGAYRFPMLAEGPAELQAAAMTAASQWKFQPSRANGVAMPVVLITSLTFTTSGMPEPATGTPSPPTPPAVSPPGSGPPIVTSSTVGGRSTVDFTTEAVPGLTPATSKCEIATDGKWGFSAEAPVRIGGSFAEGPVRQRRFLSALRGPSGEGLHVIRRGSTMAPDKQTILDLYDVTYTGLTSPRQIYIDQYHEDAPLKAPAGFTCATPVVR